jgi:hypothetical protein
MKKMSKLTNKKANHKCEKNKNVVISLATNSNMLPQQEQIKAEQSIKTKHMPSSKSEYHWTNLRSQPKDTSKRVAPGAKIDVKNIVTGPRRKAKCNYNESALLKGDMKRSSRSQPDVTFEKREKTALQNITNKMAASVVQHRVTEVVPDRGGVFVKQDESISVNNSLLEEEEEEEEQTTQLKEEPLAKIVFEHVERLGAKRSKSNPDRPYRGKFKQPLAISTFNNLKWPSNVLYASDKFNFGGMVLMEMDLEERNEYALLRDDNMIIIGSGDVILAARLDDRSGDFNVYIIDDEKKDDYEGPYKISEIVETLQVDDDDSTMDIE